MINLREATNRLEDGIIILSGPALAISGILAGVDLLTGGTMMTHTTWLQFAWAITLLISLDFQVLALGARAHRIYQRRGWWELVLAIVIAAAISYVSIQMQSIIARANSAGLDIATATAQLGINPIALIWERSALVLVLIFLAGWLRETESEQIRPESEQEASNQQFTITEEQPAMPLLVGEHQGEQGANKSEQIRALLAENASLTDRELAELVRCSVSTANKWKRRIGQESEAN
jgi:hypothetical protein